VETWNGAAILMATLGVCACGGGAPRARGEQALSSEIRYFHGGLGAGAALVTGAGGAKVWERRYEPYGVPLGDADFVDEPQGGLGMPVDASTGLADHGARWSAAASARWLTPDPRVEEPLAELARAPWELAPYAYAGGNPTLYWDPDGRDLRITGTRAKDLAAYLSAATGLSLSLGSGGQVSIGGWKGSGSLIAASLLMLIVADPMNHVQLATRSDDPFLLVGRPAPSGTAGHYQIDVADVDQLQGVDALLGQSSAVHETFEAYLHAFDNDPNAHAAQHAAAIVVENLTLAGLGASYQRGGERNEVDPDDGSQTFIVDFGQFQVEVPFDNQNGHRDFYRGVP
jgi:RHS repeat-associated protein